MREIYLLLNIAALLNATQRIFTAEAQRLRGVTQRFSPRFSALTLRLSGDVFYLVKIYSIPRCN